MKQDTTAALAYMLFNSVNAEPEYNTCCARRMHIPHIEPTVTASRHCDCVDPVGLSVPYQICALYPVPFSNARRNTPLHLHRHRAVPLAGSPDWVAHTLSILNIDSFWLPSFIYYVSWYWWLFCRLPPR